MASDETLDETPERENPCPVCGERMYAVQVGVNIYALPCFHWLYQGREENDDAT